MLLNLVDRNMDLEQAVAAPRLHFERGFLNLEPGFPADAVEAIIEAYPEHLRWDEPNMFFGGVHAVALHPGSGAFEVRGDSRRGGATEIVDFVRSPNFGQATETWPARQAQFGVKLIF